MFQNQSCITFGLTKLAVFLMIDIAYSGDQDILRRTAKGLQNAITQTESFYKINLKKTKMPIFNRGGLHFWQGEK